MALHRDIFWIGRQWAVTGFGMQAVNQKVGGAFDVEIARLWDDDPTIIVREQSWFNAEDFAKGLAVARARYPDPLRKTPPPLPVETRLAAGRTTIPSAEATPPFVPPAEEVVSPKPATPPFELGIVNLPAKLGAMWRVKRRK